MKIIVATGNPGKMREFARIFAPYGIEAQAQGELFPDLEVEETGLTFAENAFMKANAVYQRSGKAAVADDSGLCVDALDGGPGIHTARYGGEITYPQKIQKLIAEIGPIPVEYRTARFVCHICYIDEHGTRMDFKGACEGYIGAHPQGENGFGFDPIFMVDEHRSFAQLDDAAKDAISHRGKALRAFAQALQEKFAPQVP